MNLWDSEESETHYLNNERVSMSSQPGQPNPLEKAGGPKNLELLISGWVNH